MALKKKIITATAVVLLLLLIWALINNKALEVTKINISSEKIPASFSGFKIAQVSDLHNTEIGKDNEKLIKLLKEAEPDIIVITGDFVDSRRTDVVAALSAAEKMVKIAPCYYVTGNHEARIAEYETLKDRLIDLGVTVLSDEAREIAKDGERITLIGVNDPAFGLEITDSDMRTNMKNHLAKVIPEADAYKILLSHRPEFFKSYIGMADLIFSGHAHGGQIRLPFIGGLIAPGQGFFPKYDAGHYFEGETNMIVSRGIGNSLFPLRFNNNPEIVLAELLKEDA